MLLEIHPKDPQPQRIRQVVELLDKGGVVEEKAAFRALRAIAAVAHDGMSTGGKVGADMVPPALEDAHQYQRGIGLVAEGPDMGVAQERGIGLRQHPDPTPAGVVDAGGLVKRQTHLRHDEGQGQVAVQQCGDDLAVVRGWLLPHNDVVPIADGGLDH